MALGYPKDISVGFSGIPNDVDAAFVWSGNGKTYFFKGTLSRSFYSRSVSNMTFPLFHNVSNNNNKKCSTGDQYWRFDSKADPPVSSRYPKPIKNWVGLPSSIDAAFKWENGLTYFFKDIYYYRFNDADFEVYSNKLCPFNTLILTPNFFCVSFLHSQID